MAPLIMITNVAKAGGTSLPKTKKYIPRSGTAFGAGDFWAGRGEGRRISQPGIIAVRGALKKSRFRFIRDINYINDENDDGNSDTDESNALQ